jgi:type I restriction enzyme S subunit
VGVHLDYCQTLFLSYLKNGRFRQIATITTNIAHLGAGRFSELEFPLPSAEEQIAVVEILREMLGAIDRQLEAVIDGQRKAAAQRKNILKAAFSGQLVPQDPNDEPASVLLERIRSERAKGGVKGVKRGGGRSQISHS